MFINFFFVFFFTRANPAYNAYYYGYNPYPAYPQQYNPYPYVQNDGTTAPAAPAPSGWGEYLNSIWNYVPNYPFGGSASESSESSQAESSATSSAESSGTSRVRPRLRRAPATT